MDHFTAQTGSIKAFLDHRLDTLVDRSIEIAKLNGYAPFTTTIRAAWVEAILNVNISLNDYLRHDRVGAPGPQAALEYKSDPRFAQMRHIARQHRSLGITMPMYVGLLKHFRNLYIDEIKNFPCQCKAELVTKVRDFFDETELSVASDWYNSDDNLRLREMQERSRRITLDKDRYFAIFESLRNPAFLLDKTKKLVNANEAAAELFLGDKQSGSVIYLRSNRQRKNLLLQSISQITDAMTHTTSSMWLDTSQGRRCFDARMRPLHDAVENIALGFVLILNDVTEHRRAAERAQSSERGMSRFLATMSHEIRTPLHSVLGATELLRSAKESAAAGYLDLIENAGQTLLQTLNNVLDYSKLANEPPTPRPNHIDLLDAITAFERVAAVGPNRAHRNLCFDISAHVPRYAKIDWAMVQQVLSNLVSNALRADDGRGVSVSTTLGGVKNQNLRFEVTDHGPGIPDEYAQALFCAFDEVRTRDTGSGGAGLGLAIAQYLVQSLRGSIGYENRSIGALVWFEVPFEPSDAPSPAFTDTAALASRFDLTGSTCLLIDDDPIGSAVTTGQLEQLGLKTHCVASVAEARKAATENVYDIFVVDYLLPDGDGPTLVRDLQNKKPQEERYIALTANIEALERNKDLSDLFDATLAKPVDKDGLLAALLPNATLEQTCKTNKVQENLSSLSPQTQRAMAQTFQDAWGDFRESLRTENKDNQDLGYMAHRLAGSTAILGLNELEKPLRALETAWQICDKPENIRPLLIKLDRDLCEINSWVALSKSVGL